MVIERAGKVDYMIYFNRSVLYKMLEEYAENEDTAIYENGGTVIYENEAGRIVKFDKNNETTLKEQ